MKLLIGFVVLTALLAVAGSFFVGIKSFDGTVAERPYEEGLAWDKIRRKRVALGWGVRLENRRFTTGRNEITISVLNRFKEPLNNANLSLVISRPSTTKHDREVKTVRLDEGLFRATAVFPLSGYWDVKMEVRKKRETLAFDKRVFVEESGPEARGVP